MNQALVTVIVSDPWEFPDENQGRLAFVARVVGRANGNWLLQFQRPVVFREQEWHYAIPTTRFLGQEYFDKTGQDEAPANIEFVTDQQATDERWLSAFDRYRKTNNPGVIGSVQVGVANIIPKGGDSYIEPRWVPKET